MSSRSLAAARARRAGENAPPISGNRPVTSIGSYAQQQMPPPSANVRVSRGQAPPQQQQQQQQQQNPNGLPFNKLSISDAIGLITLRLGRVEQWIIETEHENSENESSGTDVSSSSRIIDSTLLTNFINRLDTIEKRENSNGSGSGVDAEVVTKLTDDVSKLNEHLAKIVDESSKHSLLTAKHNEQLFRFERELVETKDILKTFMLKYDQFTSEITEKLGDFEYAITELEKNIPLADQTSVTKGDEETQNNDGNANANATDNDNDIDETDESATLDLKSMIRQELASESI